MENGKLTGSIAQCLEHGRVESLPSMLGDGLPQGGLKPA